ncbi:MAG: hypothetical protein E7260_05675 [Lachnospiraceae bacterium]|nr:hypothetical protein [Lachnospiraceae bacterium]
MNSKEALEKIKNIIGHDKYNELLRELSGVTVYFPADAEWHDKDQRNISLREDFYSGKYEISDLAKKYELSISRVYKIIQRRL